MEKFDDQLYGNQQFKSRPKVVYHTYAQAIKEIFNPKSIIDLGCANALALDYWQKCGIKVSGVEPAKAAFKYMPESIKPKVKQLDLRRPLNLGKFSLVNFTEVAEHIDKKYETIVLKNVVNCVQKYLVISWSNEIYRDKPQEHINTRPAGYVRKRLIGLGLNWEPELTKILKQKLLDPKLKNWRHWSKNILVFSRIPQSKRILIRHYEWLPSYSNKNIGFFMKAAEKAGFSVRTVINRNDWQSLFKTWHRVWLYPFEKNLIIKLLILKLFNNRVIIKLDSLVLSKWRGWLVEKLTAYILVESQAVAKPFGNTKKLIQYSGGLSRENIELIQQLKVKRTKQILFCGRPTWQKGIDRFKKIRLKGWKLKIASNLSGEDYYREILKSSLIVLPTRGEGWPNVFQDAWFSKRLFLTTNKAQCGEGILNPDFYTNNINKAVKKIINNLNWYYKNYDRLYDSAKFVVADKVWLSLIKNQG